MTFAPCGDSTDVQARQSLRQGLAALRRGLGSARSALLIDGHSVGLNSAQLDVDVAEFESVAAKGTTDALKHAVSQTILHSRQLPPSGLQSVAAWPAPAAPRRDGLRRPAPGTLLEGTADRP